MAMRSEDDFTRAAEPAVRPSTLGARPLGSLAPSGSGARALLDRDEVEGVLSGAFYAPAPAPAPRAKPVHMGERPAHYKVICISMYTDDLERLDEMVDRLKERGLTKANRSALIRHALGQVDLAKVPKGL
jgi:hypothetical protein